MTTSSAKKETGTEAVVIQKPPRLQSLDFLRGLTVAFMILVNDPGDWGHIYWPLDHSKWNGCTPTDLVAPFFLFMVGVAIVYALSAKVANNQSHGKLMLTILRRTVIIVFLGIFMGTIITFLLGLFMTVNGSVDFAHLRIPGILQRIGIVYGICSILYLKTSIRTQVYIAIACLVGYFLIMTLVPVPGFGPANLNPGTNLGAYVDRAVFGVNHLWSERKTWDPEGLLSYIPSIATTLIGVFVGTYLKKDKLKSTKQISQLGGVGILLIIGGLIWNIWFPINKALWSSSYALLTAGLAIVCLALSYWIIDIKGNNKLLPPFLAFGRNAIAAYILSDFIPTLLSLIPATYHGIKTNVWGWVYDTLCVPYFSPVNASLVGAILTVIIIFIPVWVLYKKNIIVKI